MTENVKRRQELERMICTAVIEAALAKGYKLIVDDGDEESTPSTSKARVLKIMFNLDECYLHFIGKGRGAVKFRDTEGHVGWVRFIFGNGNGGADVISDYSTNLETLLKPAQKIIDKYQ